MNENAPENHFAAAALDEDNQLIAFVRARTASLNACVRQRDAALAELEEEIASLQESRAALEEEIGVLRKLLQSPDDNAAPAAETDAQEG